MTRILLVEDDHRLRTSLALTLGEAGYAVTEAATLAQAREGLSSPAASPDLIVLDVRLSPTESGVDLVRQLVAESRLPPTLVISGAATIAETVEALRLGVFDFIEKPVSREHLLQSLRNALERTRLERQVATLERRLDARCEMLGESPPMAALREQIARVAATEARVLIVGESGTGKELVAEQIHRQSRRRNAPFVKVNCAAIPAPLVEAELFGHARGAFTDARTARAGLFEEADGGTLLLDEIGDMNHEVQARLLRVLEDGSIRRLGETQERRVNVRVLAATHRDLEAASGNGQFRHDLFFRLAHVPLAVPALRERHDDIALLFDHFLATLSAHHRLRRKEVRPDVYPRLAAYAWPGNVRELRNACERLVVLGSDPLTVEQLPVDILRNDGVAEGSWLRPTRLSSGDIVPFQRFKVECQREYLEAVLQRTGWNVSTAARLLDLQRTHVHAKLVALGLERPEGSPQQTADRPQSERAAPFALQPGR